MIALMITVAVAAGAPSPNAWALVEKGALAAGAVEPSPLYARVQAQERHADPLLDEDVVASLDAVRAYAPALDALDAAVATASCTLPKNLDAAAIVRLADAALVTALADGADKKPGRAAVDVGRAADLATLVARCAKPSPQSAALAISIGEHARTIAWFLAEQRAVDDKGLARIAVALAPSAAPAVLERAVAGRSLSMDEQRTVDDVGKRLDAAAKDQTALTAAAADFEHVARPEHVVAVRCDASDDPEKLSVTRAVAHVLERKQDALMNDSVVGPSLDGRGVLVLSAGPIARSCGFADGDLVVEVNGISTGRVDQALVQGPQQVARDGEARFRVMRHGNPVTWRVVVAK